MSLKCGCELSLSTEHNSWLEGFLRDLGIHHVLKGMQASSVIGTTQYYYWGVSTDESLFFFLENSLAACISFN